MSTISTDSFAERPPKLWDKIKASPLADNPLLLGVAGIGFAVSFQTISHEATLHHMPGASPLYPVGIDIGILALVLEARHLAKRRRSDLVPRVIAWALSLGTIYVNVHGSPPHDWLGRTLHAIMPALWIVFLELTRYRQRADIRKSEQVDPVPLVRWLLDPWGTAKLKRRMVLQNVQSYRLAAALEDARHHMRDLAVAHYGGWLRYLLKAPALLRTNIRKGRLGDEVTAAVADAIQWGRAGGWEAVVIATVARAVLAGDALKDALRQSDGAQAELTTEPADQVQAEPVGSGQGRRPEPVQDDSSSGSGHSQRSGPRRRRRGRRGGSASSGDVTTALEIVKMKAANPNMKNVDIGRNLNVSGSYVGRILNRPPILGPDQQATLASGE